MSLSVTLTNSTLKVKVAKALAYYAFKLMTLALDLIRTDQSALFQPCNMIGYLPSLIIRISSPEVIASVKICNNKKGCTILVCQNF
jgi:hypothetical protein